MTTKIPAELSSTPGISDSSNATAITITSDENILIGSSTSIASNIGLQVTGTDAAGFMSLFRDDSSVVVNDDLGGILFYGDDNNATTQFAYIRATAEGTHADGDNPTAIRFGTTADGSETVTERMRINSSGNVGIGNTNPTERLHVQAASINTDVARFTGANSDRGLVITTAVSSGTNDSLIIYNADATSGQHAFKTNGTERMRIDSSGEIHINKTSTINNGQLEVLAQTNHQAIVAKVQTNTNNNFLGYNSSGQVTSYIGGGGNYYFSGTNQSDRDLKENIQSITESSLEKVKQLEPKTFNFKESEGFKTNKKTGFIAQEVAEIFGTENGVATGTDGKKDMGIDSVGLIAHLTKAIQEQQDIIEDLKSRIETLEG